MIKQYQMVLDYCKKSKASRVHKMNPTLSKKDCKTVSKRHRSILSNVKKSSKFHIPTMPKRLLEFEGQDEYLTHLPDKHTTIVYGNEDDDVIVMILEELAPNKISVDVFPILLDDGDDGIQPSPSAIITLKEGKAHARFIPKIYFTLDNIGREKEQKRAIGFVAGFLGLINMDRIVMDAERFYRGVMPAEDKMNKEIFTTVNIYVNKPRIRYRGKGCPTGITKRFTMFVDIGDNWTML